MLSWLKNLVFALQEASGLASYGFKMPLLLYTAMIGQPAS